MSADCFTVLRCNGRGCKARWPAKGQYPGWHVSARAAAERDGWRQNLLIGDMCPEHATDRGWTPQSCADGTYHHDFKGQSSCPACGWTGIATASATGGST